MCVCVCVWGSDLGRVGIKVSIYGSLITQKKEVFEPKKESRSVFVSR